MKKVILNNTSGNRMSIVKYFLTGLVMLLTMSVFAHSNVKEYNYNTLSLFSNSFFLALLFIVILLLVVILVLADVLRNVATASMKREKEKNNTTKILSVAALTFLLSSNTSFAQDAFHTPIASTTYGGLSSTVFYLMSTIIVFELLVFIVLINAIRIFVKQEVKEKVVAEKVAVPEVSLFEKFNASVSLEKEQDILMDHDYDGIKELDNDLPPWWKYGFYLTIVFAFIYLVHYHVTSTGDLQLAEYNKSVAAAHEAKEAYQKLMADNVTENNVKLITDKHELEEAGKLYKQNCAACHGQMGEGGIGPNLTDQYWLHGGSIKDVFISIKYGWPDKGMKSWQADLTPSKMNELASYIITLAGTNPPNQKEKQGELYMEGGAVSDSLAKDSTAIILPDVDSIKVEAK